MTPSERAPFRLTGFHVLAITVAFFGAIIAVNVGMAAAAYSTFPGEVAATPYEDGLAFNSTLARRDAERRLGWRAKIASSLDETGRVTLKTTIVDAKGLPVQGLHLKGRLERPATERGRIQADFDESAPGVYEASVAGAPGAWDLTLSGTDPKGAPFEAERRLTWR
jgi:nitrogen fixation protein FixH